MLQRLCGMCFGFIISATLFALAGCAVSSPDDGQGDGNPDDMINAGDWYQPAVDATWQWQIQPNANDAINTSYSVDVYDIDLFDNDAAQIAALQSAGRRVICYFSAGSYEDFREDAGDFAASDLGNTLDGFPDERWVDIRSDAVRAIMLARLDLAAQKGCDGVEPDNVTGFNNDTGFPLSASDQMDFNRFLADAAHDRGLAVGLKNDLEQIPQLVGDFDFAVNEQCAEFDECAVYDTFIDAGKPVFAAEYADAFVNDADAREQLCIESNAQGRQTLILPLDLDDAFRFSCQDE